MYKSEQYKNRLARATKRRSSKRAGSIIGAAIMVLVLGTLVMTVYYVAWRQIDYRVCTTASPTLAQQLKCN